MVTTCAAGARGSVVCANGASAPNRNSKRPESFMVALTLRSVSNGLLTSILCQDVLAPRPMRCDQGPPPPVHRSLLSQNVALPLSISQLFQTWFGIHGPGKLLIPSAPDTSWVFTSSISTFSLCRPPPSTPSDPGAAAIAAGPEALPPKIANPSIAYCIHYLLLIGYHMFYTLLPSTQPAVGDLE